MKTSGEVMCWFLLSGIGTLVHLLVQWRRLGRAITPRRVFVTYVGILMGSLLVYQGLWYVDSRLC